MIETEPAVVVTDLTRTFKDIVAVEGLSFSVKKGELFGLLGPDGAGKTTTLRMLAGVLPPTRGDAAIFGTSVASDPEGVKHEIAYMSQRFGLYTDLTVLENIHFYADLYRVPKGARPDRLERLFAFSGLAPFKDRLAGALSGGMKQKLGISCALVHQPRLLLLDEPTFGVDPVSRRDLWLIVHDMVSEGTTVIVSTSYMDEAERMDRVVLLHKGRLGALDTPDALREGLAWEILVVATPDLQKARKVALTIDGVLEATAFGETLHLAVTSAEKMAPVVEAALREAGFRVTGIRAAKPGMEDVFMEHMARADRHSGAPRHSGASRNPEV
jgi:ABC-2 type transport system ATP-binding protein